MGAALHTGVPGELLLLLLLAHLKMLCASSMLVTTCPP
jgi:hypothetical protein